MKAWQKTLVAFGSVFAPAAAMAAEAEPLNPMAQALSLTDVGSSVALQEEAAVPDKISGFVGSAFVTDYVTRFILLENQGFIAQPYAELDFALFEEKEGFFKKAYAYAGLWSSLHTNKEFAANGLSGWYEFDWYAGIATDIEGGFNLNLQYVEFLSPAGAFGTAKNVQLVISFDDSPYLKSFALKPYIQLFRELDGKAGTGGDEGLYMEVGVNPGLTIDEAGKYPITLTLPIAAGFSLGNFYNDAEGDEELFGGFRIGLATGIPLAFMNDAGYGTWSASASVNYFVFGDGVKDANSGAGGDDPDGELVGSIGVQCNF